MNDGADFEAGTRPSERAGKRHGALARRPSSSRRRPRSKCCEFAEWPLLAILEGQKRWWGFEALAGKPAWRSRPDVSDGYGSGLTALLPHRQTDSVSGHPDADVLVAAAVAVKRPARGWRVERRLQAQMRDRFVFVGR